MGATGKRVKQNRNKVLGRKRGHGLAKNVRVMPSALKKAAARGHLYMHSAACRRLRIGAWTPDGPTTSPDTAA